MNLKAGFILLFNTFDWLPILGAFPFSGNAEESNIDIALSLMHETENKQDNHVAVRLGVWHPELTGPRMVFIGAVYRLPKSGGFGN